MFGDSRKHPWESGEVIQGREGSPKRAFLNTVTVENWNPVLLGSSGS